MERDVLELNSNCCTHQTMLRFCGCSSFLRREGEDRKISIFSSIVNRSPTYLQTNLFGVLSR